MANLYTLAAIGATFTPSKNMITLFNGTGSGIILKVWKIWALNNQTVAVTGILGTLELRLITSTSGGGSLTALKHNSTITSLPSQVVAAEGATNTLSSLFRKIYWSTDEPIATSSTMDEMALNKSWSEIWNIPITNTNLEPITLNEGQGICLSFNTVSSVGQADFFIEFTST